MIGPIGLVMVTFAAAWVGTGLIRRYALTHSVLDIPNERSSHRLPTPRGGGVAFVVAFLAAVACLVWLGVVPPRVAAGLGGAGGLVALVGFLDDHGHLAARWRLLAHVVAAAWLLVFLDGPPSLTLWHDVILSGWPAWVIATFGLVWLLNLFNFMDGIDGIAGVEAVVCCVGGASLWLVRPVASGDAILSAALAAAVLGFLLWNAPPARIFMGDAGSGFLGLMLGGLAIQSGHVVGAWLWSWLILLGVFVVDATVTLVRRLVRGEKVYQAHRSHAYQHAALRAGAHRPVTLVVAAINFFWLLPLALLVASGRCPPFAGIAIAYTPLLWLAARFDAGASSAARAVGA